MTGRGVVSVVEIGGLRAKWSHGWCEVVATMETNVP